LPQSDLTPQRLHPCSAGGVHILRLGLRMDFPPEMPGQKSTYTRVRNPEATSEELRFLIEVLTRIAQIHCYRKGAGGHGLGR
jgi:hypothetical protein